MGNVTAKGLMDLLGTESRLADTINACEIVKPEGLREILANPNVARDPFYLHNRLAKGKDGPYGTGGHHVGRDLSGKLKPGGLDEKGPDPFGKRQFTGNEFQGMLMFGPDGRPAFHSLWPEGTPPEARKVLKINIATKIPAYITDPDGTVKPVMDGRRSEFGGQSIEEAFEPVDERVITQVRKYAANFEKTFGIMLDVQIDHPDPDPHITLMAYGGGSRRLAGFASFPEAMRGWERLARYGHKPGYMMLNADHMKTISDKQVHDLFAHEFGHSIGWAHPHDLAIFDKLTQRDALTMTTMPYSDLEYTPFDGQDGAELGPMDYGLRKWLHNPPALNAGGAVYDLEAQHQKTLAENQHTTVFRREGLLPAIPILAHGGNNELRGTAAGNDYLDTNTGYSCAIRHPETGVEQKFALVEGHLDRVYGIGGNNTIIACKTGDQQIYPGTGQNEVQCLYADMQGEKTIASEGRDTLVITEAMLEKYGAPQRDGDNVVIPVGESTIRLKDQAKGKGISALRVVNGQGVTVYEKDVSSAPLPDKAEIMASKLDTPKWQARTARQARREPTLER